MLKKEAHMFKGNMLMQNPKSFSVDAVKLLNNATVSTNHYVRPFFKWSSLGKPQKSSAINGQAIKRLSPPPSSLMAIGFFCVLKYPQTDFDNFFIRHNFWT